MSKQKSPEAIMKAILDVLKDGSPRTPSEIADMIHSNSVTIKNYIYLIDSIQSFPRIEISVSKKVIIARLRV